MIRWHGYLGGKPGPDLSGTLAFTLPDGKQPNAFHRLMQWLILGIYWRREPTMTEHTRKQIKQFEGQAEMEGKV